MKLREERIMRLVTQLGAASAIALILPAAAAVTAGLAASAPQVGASSPRAAGPDAGKAAAKKDGSPSEDPPVKLGLTINSPGAFGGYTLLNPGNKKTTYLIDNAGRVVKTWESEHNSMHAAYLLENGHLFRVAALAGADRAFGGGGGSAGRMQEFDWDGRLLWDFQWHNDKQFQHHDALKLPSGNVLMVVWDKKSRDEAIAAGRKPELVSEYLLPDSIVEVKPTGKTTAQVVWEWHLWDHLVQDHDSSKPNYGDVAAHPELVDINLYESPMGPGPGGPWPGGPGPGGPGRDAQAAARPRDPAKDAERKAEAEKLKSLGYVGSPKQQRQRINPDWVHVNSVDYNAEFDQIMLGVHEFSEIWIIDHSTTTVEAAGHTGGRSGKGGDLLYRWGNPKLYRAGTKADQKLFAQHNAQWIPRGLPGAGHVLVFNNGGHRPDGSYSSVDELVLPVDRQGRYTREPGCAYGPKDFVWSYTAPKKSDFYSPFISGAHRLPNGNTFICSGANGTLFEVTPHKEVVWKYVNPVKGGFGPRGPMPPNQVLPWFLQDLLGLSADQKKQIDTIQQTVDQTLDKVLDDQQKKTLASRSGFPRGGPGAMPPPGQLMTASTQVLLKPTTEQKSQLSALQKEVDAKLDKLLTADQKDHLKQIRADFLRGGPPRGPGGPGGPPAGPGGPGGPPGGPGGWPGGPPGGSGLFRAYKYGPEFSGLAGRDLRPGKTVEELQPKESEKAKGPDRK